MRYCVDMDGTITVTDGGDYENARPNWPVIGWVQARHNEGHEITVFTARGTETGTDWEALTRDQLRRWGVPYSRLMFGKPAADVYVDDRAVRPEEL